ncbi:hypothetical protein DB32_006621 [Sandaracinus amylolyticus]|uniref:Uncharacterized protein n=1 Tax=Sandaracinus amylolyticus TaxID=927083 RepID=A0A0F6YMN4_9BACT|nr:hypothetical protein DB32_006621 [Sandaracinus amylolyticus]
MGRKREQGGEEREHEREGAKRGSHANPRRAEPLGGKGARAYDASVLDPKRAALDRVGLARGSDARTSRSIRRVRSLRGDPSVV